MLKLKDIVWEITLCCHKGCKYCGSKNVLRDENPTLSSMLDIAKQIGQYGVDTVILSGGEPGELNFSEMDQIIDILEAYGVKVQVVTNGKLLNFDQKILNRFDLIGLSINSVEDHIRLWTVYGDTINNCVMVTNFGTHNIWDFDGLASLAKNFRSWQVQLTTGEYLLPPDGISYLRSKIRKLEGVKYVLADNLQDEHKCSAGINSCGITCDGDIIPCLSERAHGKGGVEVQGNLFKFKGSLKDIWETEFKEIRFSDRGWVNSCRNCINYPTIKELTPAIAPVEKVKPKEVAKIFSKIVDEVIPDMEKRRTPEEQKKT